MQILQLHTGGDFYPATTALSTGSSKRSVIGYDSMWEQIIIIVFVQQLCWQLKISMYQPVSILSNDYYVSFYYNGLSSAGNTTQRVDLVVLPVDAFVVTDDK